MIIIDRTNLFIGLRFFTNNSYLKSQKKIPTQFSFQIVFSSQRETGSYGSTRCRNCFPEFSQLRVVIYSGFLRFSLVVLLLMGVTNTYGAGTNTLSISRIKI